MIELKARSGCKVTVSGGTERGHAPGRFSHGRGYKIDILPGRCIDRHIRAHTRYTGHRSDGARMHTSPQGDLYADEGDHWDITYK